VYSVLSVAHPLQLAQLLTDFRWPLCTAFELRGYLFCNDAISPDAVAPWVIIKDGLQLTRVTFGWLSLTEALAWLQSLVGGRLSPELYAGELFPRRDLVRVLTDHPKDRPCELCVSHD